MTTSCKPGDATRGIIPHTCTLPCSCLNACTRNMRTLRTGVGCGWLPCTQSHQYIVIIYIYLYYTGRCQVTVCPYIPIRGHHVTALYQQ
ncbi:hypothetical protein GDO78_004604 [Eleutherodactylus coqui]|uniref:Uncharacterized protein n=1 Tax=Eleutherodactylus coqui TaxID=57060 RepID=A0A8J6ET95_ELECQ|nr:hypothetical protein GDO78_004604 [Eleutherodactylus coqui]